MVMLCAYVINSTPVNSLGNYLEEDLLGNPPFVAATSVPLGYQDVSSLGNWAEYGELTGKDYKYIRQEIGILVITTGWTNLTSDEKLIAVTYFTVGSVERDEIMPIDNQIMLGLLHHQKSIKARETRLALAQMQIFNRLDKADWGVLSADASHLLNPYLKEGREGTTEGDLEGIFDYIDGSARTGNTWDGQGQKVGLRDQTFSVIGFDNCSDFSDYLLGILKNGNY